MNTSTINTTRGNTATSWIKIATKFTIAIVVLGSIGLAANRLIETYKIGESICTITFATAVLVAIFYRAINPYGWTLILSGLGYPTKAKDSISIWLRSESRRWLPGGIWGYASRAIESGKMGVPATVASASMLVELMITMAAAVVVSFVGLLFYYDQLSETFQQLIFEITGGNTALIVGWASLIVVTVTGLGFVARHKFSSKVQGLAERFKALSRVKLTWPKLFAALAYMTAMAGLNGCVNLTLLPLVDNTSSVPPLVMIASTATAWVIGFLAFFSPGGILVREATLAALLLPWLPYESGITLAVLSRIAQLAAEVACMAPVILCDRTSPVPTDGLPQSSHQS